MDLICFRIGREGFPVYRSATPRQSRRLRILLGEGFHLRLPQGTRVGPLLFDVVSQVCREGEILLSVPEGARVLGEFELGAGPASAAESSGARERHPSPPWRRRAARGHQQSSA